MKHRAEKEKLSFRTELHDVIKETLRTHRYINREIVRKDLVVTVRITEDGISVELYPD